VEHEWDYRVILAVLSRLFPPIVQVPPLDPFAFDMVSRKPDYIRALAPARELLAATGLVSIVAKVLGQFSLTARSLLPAVNRHYSLMSPYFMALSIFATRFQT
jgi:hypothetical protein